MSGSILDKLVVQVHLDKTEYQRGERDVIHAFEKTKESAKKTGDTVERAGKSGAESIKGLTREVMTLFAVFTAGRGLKEFAQDVTKADNALGKLSYTLKTSPETISAWGRAVERIGGSGQAAAQSFKSFSNSIQELKTTGNTGMLPWLYKLQAAGGKTINLGKGLNEIFIDLSKNLSAVAARDPAMANFLGERLGLDHDTIQLMMKGPAAVRSALAAAAKTAVTDGDTKRAAELVRSFTTLAQTSEKFGRLILNELSPDIVGVTDKMSRWVDANERWLKSDIVGSVRTLSNLLSAIVDKLSKAVDLVNELGRETGLTRFLGRFMGFKESELDLGPNGGVVPPGGLRGRARSRADEADKWYWKADRWVRKKLNLPPDARDPTAGGAPTQPEQHSSRMPRFRGLTAEQKAETAANIRRVAGNLGVDPNDLAAVMSFETGGTMDPWKRGPTTKWGQHIGFIQMGGPQRERFGYTQNSTITQKMDAVERYLRAHGVRPGMDRTHLYSAVIHGNANGGFDVTDKFGTSARSGAARMAREGHINALRALERGAGGGGGAAAPATAAPAPAASPYGGLIPRENFGAGGAAGMRFRPITRNNTNSTQIGTISINTLATDASGIARDIGPALAENSYATMANNGAD